MAAPGEDRWRWLDVDADYDVDLADFAEFANLFAASNP